MQMLFAGLIQQCIRVAAILRIADLVAERPSTSAELAAKTDTHEPSLYRVLRALANVGIFAENPDRTFDSTPIADLLRTDSPNSMRDFAILQGEEWGWRAFVELIHTVKTGETAQVKAHGMSLFEFLAQHPADEELFNRAMTSYSQAAIPAIVAAYDFSAVGTLVDVGGGHGSLLAGIVEANPHLRGVLFDLPSVTEAADPLLKDAGVRDRIDLVTGDFFESVPTGADAYIMKNIVHDWDDGRAVDILTNISSAVPPGGKVLIVDLVVPEAHELSPAKLVDIQMLVTTGGKERTEAEVGELLSMSGLRWTRIVPTRSPTRIIEAVPV